MQHYIDNPHLQAICATAGFLHPTEPGTLYGLVYAMTARALGGIGRWGSLKGGMGEITNRLKSKISDYKGIIKLQTSVSSIRPLKNRKIIVEGSRVHEEFDKVVMAIDGHSMKSILGGINKEHLASSNFEACILHVGLSDYPNFPVIEKHYQNFDSTVVLAQSMSALEKDIPKIESGKSIDPIISIKFQTNVDKTVAPHGKHLLTIQPHYCPAGLNWTASKREGYINNIIGRIEQHAPGFSTLIEHLVLLTPDDLEKTYGLQGRHCFHGPITWQNSFEDRFSDIAPRTNIPDIYVCSSAIHPGGTVSGAPGYRGAQAILHDLES